MAKQSHDNRNVKRIAYFVSPHGFGHAARAAAVMQSVSDSEDAIEFDIFTTVPSWFFQDSLSDHFRYHRLLTDIGLVQSSAFRADLPKTLQSLNRFLPFQTSLISEISETVARRNCCLIISDISPLGISVAKEIGLPSLLVENFTWDWIYHQYVATDSRFKWHIDYLKSWFEAADYHIKTEPVCSPGPANLTTSPVSRKVRTCADRIRRQLKIGQSAKMVLITTGGIKQSYDFLDRLKQLPHIHFVLPGAAPKLQYRENSIILPHRSDFYHPDLVNAADAVVGKAGYSTLSEVYQAGVPFGYVLRSNFRESKPLAAFIAGQMEGIALTETDFSAGNWTAKIEALLGLKRHRRRPLNGSHQIGKFIRKQILQHHA